MVFPRGPAHAGAFELQGNGCHREITADAHAIVDGKPVTTAKLHPDTAGNPDRRRMGSLRLHVIVRGVNASAFG